MEARWAFATLRGIMFIHRSAFANRLPSLTGWGAWLWRKPS